jgi:hypothetical protein
MEIESLKSETEKAMKESMKTKRALVQAQADAEEQQKAAAKRKRLVEESLDEPVTKRVNPSHISFKLAPIFVTDPDFRLKSANPLFGPTRVTYLLDMNTSHPLRRHLNQRNSRKRNLQHSQPMTSLRRP